VQRLHTLREVPTCGRLNGVPETLQNRGRLLRHGAHQRSGLILSVPRPASQHRVPPTAPRVESALINHELDHVLKAWAETDPPVGKCNADIS
jgi:hypothetical protein